MKLESKLYEAIIKINRKLKENTNIVNVGYIQSLYREFNKRYFDNQLNDYPIKVKNLKGTLGKVVFTGVRGDSSTFKIKEIIFTDLYSITDEQLQGIILHEMIHVYIIENKIDDNSIHGWAFKSKRIELNKLAPFYIPEVEDVTFTNVNTKTTKGIDSLAIISMVGSPSIIVFNISNLPNIINDIDGFPKGWQEAIKPIILKSSDPELEKYPKSRKINVRNFKMYHIDRGKAQEILNNSDILKEY